MIKAIHVATECFPAAKAGGLGDVVGSLPNYFPLEKVEASVVMPRYSMPWFEKQTFKRVFSAEFYLAKEKVQFEVHQLDNDNLTYPFYCVSIPGKFDRNSVYLASNGHGFKDEVQRNISFQRAVLIWLKERKELFDIVHCHDHQSGLIPFFMKYGLEFGRLANIPSFFTIHNAAYFGAIPWSSHDLLPEFLEEDGGWLDWDNAIVPLAAAIKCAWKVSTVSPNYLKEIQEQGSILQSLYRDEAGKSQGILNGIDNELWNPKKDELIFSPFKKDWSDFKSKNREKFNETFGLENDGPLIGFIGRLAYQKGAELIPNAIRRVFQMTSDANFVILGTGDKEIERKLMEIDGAYDGRVKVMITYNEAIARNIYASSDFLLMPSRFEPCGLNQLFAMRYGSIPIVRITGGLKDTVVDIGDDGGGITFFDASSKELAKAILRGIEFYENTKWFKKTRKENAETDYSWKRSIKEYAGIYRELLNVKTV